MQHVYKCVKPILPVAKTLVFQSTDGGISMRYLEKDYDTWNKDDIGYTQPATGDSGSPYMVKRRGRGGKFRYTFVATVSSYQTFGNQAAGTYMKGRRTQCRENASKLTKEILAWIKHKAGIIDT